MNPAGIRVDTAEFERGVDRAMEAMRVGGLEGLAETAAKARDRAAQKAPRLTGALSRSLSGSGQGRLAPGGVRLGNDPKGSFAEIGTTLFYGRFQEVGTKHLKARRFIRSAVYATRKEMNPLIAGKVRLRLSRDLKTRRKK